MKTSTVVAVFTLFVAGCLRPAQPEGTFAPLGTLQGTVIDGYDQSPVANAKITINFEGRARTVTTDATGTFSFVDIPASGNPSTTGGATGTYSVNLDLSGVTGDRKYLPFRTSQVSVQFTELRRADTTTAQTSNAVQNSVPVNFLVSNVTFTVRQARATVKATVYDEQLKPKAGIGIALVSRSSSTAVPNGATVALATTDAMGKLTFSNIEEGTSYQLALADQNLNFSTSGNNYTGGTFTAFELGIETVLPPVVLTPRPVSDPAVPYVSVSDPQEDAVRVPADVNKPIVITFSEPMNTQRGLNMVTGIRRLGPRNRPDDGTQFQLAILFDKSWDSTGTVLTIVPTTPLETGFRYAVDFNTSLMMDIAGNIRNGSIPFTSPALPDQLAVSNGANDLQFAIGSSATEITLAAVNQEPDTADNSISTGVLVTRASVIESDPAATESSFLTALNASFYTVNRNDVAYITWSAPTQPVRRYRVWTRVGTNNPILVTRSTNPWGVSNTRLEPLAPSQTAFSMPLSDLSAVLTSETGGFPGVGLGNTRWDNNLSVQLGVSVVNADGQESAPTFTTLRDNTGPAFLRGQGTFGISSTYLVSNDTVALNYNSNCATSSTVRVLCPRVANRVAGIPALSQFGQRLVQFDLSEPVDAASVIAANVDLVDGTLANSQGIPNPNVSGTATEPDATLGDVVPLNVVNGRTSRIGVVLNNFFGADTGDKVVLRKTAAAAVRDVAGNPAKDEFLMTATLVDDYPPMMKSISVEPNADTMTLVFTKWFNAPAPASPSQGNVALNEFSFTNFNANQAQLLRATRTITSANEYQVVLQFADVGYLRGFNSTDAQCARGSRVQTQSLTSIDFSTAGGRSTAVQTDDGQSAYENMVGDPAEPNFSPGAYMPTNGLGTRSSFRDAIAPRLSNNFSDRTLSPASNQFTAPASSSTTANIEVSLTEFSANENSATAANSMLNPANWTVRAIDLGTDGWTGNTANDPAASNLTVTINSVSLFSNQGSSCGRSPRVRLNVTFANGNTTAQTVGVSLATLGAAVADQAGNAVGSSGFHATWAFNPDRRDTSSSLSPGWDVR